ncbi:MAG TPA: DUF4493 domain-containing protein [Candidatus Parabacteroides intestinigallinarum]|uniref:DUF4493 domain-containing protein n=1 Tax=Candidatus Parabacteroides intestinigallinarum TaxID=2838722 RepID=A0A9D1XQB5_9BACT|nr:DUF4493 domain-containing protein [Candidatus Parabacteroides intestinigallinarum]
MKHSLLIYIATIFLLAACGQEELPSGEGVGYLSLENIQLQAAEEEIIQTRAVDNDLYVQIDDGTPYSPGNAPSTIELSAGTHTLKAYTSENYKPGEAWYYGETSFNIEEGKVNAVTLEVPMRTFGIRLELPEGFEDYFSDPTFTVTYGDKEGTITADGGTYHFLYDSEVSAVSYTLSATNADGEPLSQEGSRASWPAEKKPLEAGKIYVITYDYATKSLNLLAD